MFWSLPWGGEGGEGVIFSEISHCHPPDMSVANGNAVYGTPHMTSYLQSAVTSLPRQGQKARIHIA